MPAGIQAAKLTSRAATVVLTSILVLSFLSTMNAWAQLLPTYGVSIDPSSVTINQGGSGNTLVTVTSISGFSDPVQLQFTGGPAGVTVTIAINPVTPPANGNAQTAVFFEVDASASPGSYPMTLVCSSASGGNKNLDFTLVIQSSGPPPDFTISISPNFLSIPQGQTSFAAVTIGSLNGWTNAVALGADNVPAGVNFNFNPTPVNPPAGGSANSQVTISVSGSAQVGTYTVVIRGSGASQGPQTVIVQHSTTMTLQVSSVGPAPDFTISVSPSSLTLSQGNSGSVTVTVSSIGGFSSPVALGANGIPSGVSLSFSPNPIQPPAGGSTYSTISLGISSSAPPGTYGISIVGNSGGLSHGTTLTLTIQQASKSDFTITVSASSVQVIQGSSAQVVVTITSVNGFNSPVSLYTAWLGAPQGVTVSLPGSVTPPPNAPVQVGMTISAGSGAPQGSYTLTVAGSGNNIVHGTNVIVIITAGAGDFALILTQPQVNLVSGLQTTTAVSIQSLGSFASAVVLQNSVPPNGVSLSFSPNPIAPSAGATVYTQLTISASSSTATGSYQIQISGTSGSIVHTTTLTLIITQAATPDYSMTTSPPSLSLAQGQGTTSTITVYSQNGFSANVGLSASWVSATPDGVTFTVGTPVTPQPNQAATSTLLINAAAGSSLGSFTLRIAGSGGGSGGNPDSGNAIVHTVDINIQVNPGQATATTTTPVTTTVITTETTTPAPRCLIATAAYGSEINPEVQFLRNFRDQQVLRTFAGSSFMLAFNAWYYSFSPTIAQAINEHPNIGAAARIVLYPLVAILRLGAAVFQIFPANPEAAAILSGLMVGALLGVTYFAIPASLVVRRRRVVLTAAWNLERAAAIILACGLIGVLTAEIFSSLPLMVIATTVTILSTLVTATLLSARTIVRLLETRTL